MKCLNCIDLVYMDDMGDGDWKCPVCGDEYNEFEDYDLYADPVLDNPFKDKQKFDWKGQEWWVGVDPAEPGCDETYVDYGDE